MGLARCSRFGQPGGVRRGATACRVALVVAALAGLLLSGCNPAGAGADGRLAEAGAEEEAGSLRIGYFPNVTHASAIAGVERGFFADALGDVTLQTSTFNAGGQAIEALFSGAIDATYIGPNPAINAFAETGGEIRIISGATSGGAYLVVNEDIEKPKDLAGTRLASPSLGNTQDVALRVWLDSKGLETDPAGGGDVSILPQENSTTLESFKAGDVDGAWVPEPWATRLIDEAGGKVLVAEATLWPEGKYVTTHLIVRKDFLDANPGIVRALLEGQVAANAFIAGNPNKAKDDIAEGILNATGQEVAGDLIAKTFANLEFTNDPIASSLEKSADDAEEVGLLEPVDLDGIYNLKLLNKVLKVEGQPAVNAK